MAPFREVQFANMGGQWVYKLNLKRREIKIERGLCTGQPTLSHSRMLWKMQGVKDANMPNGENKFGSYIRYDKYSFWCEYSFINSSYLCELSNKKSVQDDLTFYSIPGSNNQKI